ncbi:MAG: ATP-dependent DNA ligase [Balneolaceae bacterium]|nr:ATP-dependent DNA ligase [Balneolaceae bacterium]MCH8548716.1 ATP-dependent DNA ligase [Balneolaceae bacterium]
MIQSFQHLCETIQTISETRGSNAKISICSNFLRQLNDERDLELAAQFIGEGAFSSTSGESASVGSRTTGLAASQFCEIDYDLVFKPCRTATGSNSETVARLLENVEAAVLKREPRQISLQEVEEMFKNFLEISSRDDKIEVLHKVWKNMNPVEVKYFIRILGRGSLRIGFESKSLTAAIARAFKRDLESVRYAHMITGNIGKTAVLARRGELESATFRLFHPLSFMLASPIESRSVSDISSYIAEEKFDGMRAQVHHRDGEVKIFSRDLNEITASFPEVAKQIAGKNLPEIVLDGEICIFSNDQIQPFQHLQKRMGVKKPSKKILEKYPALFIAFDLLYIEGSPVFDEACLVRRSRLRDIHSEFGLPVTRQFDVADPEDVEKLFELALERGNEGLMLKQKESVYEYGKRGKSWLKVKKPGGSLDTVMMYAHAGSGKRGGLYSDFTLGVSVKDDERYEEEFIPIGKAYGGYSDEELKKMNKRIKELTVERYGPTLGLIPELVVEIEFDDIQVNRRTKAGYTLRFPRFKAIRWDLSPADVDRLKDVEQAYENKMNRKSSPQKEGKSFKLGT